MDVEEVISDLVADGNSARGWYHSYEDPRPLERPVSMPDGRPLPAELLTWLAYDATWFPIVERGGGEPKLGGEPLRVKLSRWAVEMIDEDPEGAAAEGITTEDILDSWLSSLPRDADADAWVVELPPSGSQEHFLVVSPGAGRAKVLGFHKRLELWWKYASFGAYLAHYFGYEEPE